MQHVIFRRILILDNSAQRESYTMLRMLGCMYECINAELYLFSMSFMNIRLSIPLFMSIRIRNNERKSSAPAHQWQGLEIYFPFLHISPPL